MKFQEKVQSEKLIIFLLLKLIQQNENNKEWQYYLDILTNGIESEYSVFNDMIAMHESQVPLNVSHEVITWMQMFAHIESSIKQLSSERQVSLKNNYITEFQGFDPMDIKATQHYVYWSFYMEYYQNIKVESYNNYLSLDIYRNMYQKYQPYQNDDYLTIKSIEYVCHKMNNPIDITKQLKISINESQLKIVKKD